MFTYFSVAHAVLAANSRHPLPKLKFQRNRVGNPRFRVWIHVKPRFQECLRQLARLATGKNWDCWPAALWGLQFEGFLPHSVEFLICPDARLKPQGLGSSYLQRGVWISFVLRGFRMSIHLMFHVFAAFLVASF